MKITQLIVALVAFAASAFAEANIYCTSLPNSTGQVAQIWYNGSLVRETNSFAVTLENVPVGSFTQLTCGPVAMNVPFANGTLCVNPLVQFVRIGNPILSENGTAFSSVNMLGLPPQNTLYFQWWYRNPAAEGSNFNTSNGMRCEFQ